MNVFKTIFSLIILSVCAACFGEISITASRKYVNDRTELKPVKNGDNNVIGYNLGIQTNITLISNVKTINGESILGPGDIHISVDKMFDGINESSSTNVITATGVWRRNTKLKNNTWRVMTNELVRTLNDNTYTSTAINLSKTRKNDVETENNVNYRPGPYSVALGNSARALDTYSFVWNGDNSNKSSNGDGTFSIYPQNNLSGFYIGSYSLRKWLNDGYVMNTLQVAGHGIEEDIYPKITLSNLTIGNQTYDGSTDVSVDMSGYVPTSRKINGHPLTSDITLSPQDIGVQPNATKLWNEEKTQFVGGDLDIRGINVSISHEWTNSTSAGGGTYYIPAGVHFYPVTSNTWEGTGGGSTYKWEVVPAWNEGYSQFNLYRDGTMFPEVMSGHGTNGSDVVSFGLGATYFYKFPIQGTSSTNIIDRLLTHKDKIALSNVTNAQGDAVSATDVGALPATKHTSAYGSVSYHIDNDIVYSKKYGSNTFLSEISPNLINITGNFDPPYTSAFSASFTGSCIAYTTNNTTSYLYFPTTSGTLAVGTIPTKTSELTNDSGYLTSESDPFFSNWKSGSALAAGSGSSATSTEATAYGASSSAELQATAVGAESKAQASLAVAVGKNAVANKIGCTSIGSGVTSGKTDGYSTSIGLFSTAVSDYSVAMGAYSHADKNYSAAFGYSVRASNEYSVAIGYRAKSHGDGTLNFSTDDLGKVFFGNTKLSDSIDTSIGNYVTTSYLNGLGYLGGFTDYTTGGTTYRKNGGYIYLDGGKVKVSNGSTPALQCDLGTFVDMASHTINGQYLDQGDITISYATIGAVPRTRKVAGKQLTADVSLGTLTIGDQTYDGSSNVSSENIVHFGDYGQDIRAIYKNGSVVSWFRLLNYTDLLPIMSYKRWNGPTSGPTTDEYDYIFPKKSGTIALAKATSLNAMLVDANTNTEDTVALNVSALTVSVKEAVSSNMFELVKTPVVDKVNEVKAEFYDEPLQVNWTMRMVNGEMKLFATTNTNQSVAN